jgi:hypothetical protein
LRAPLTTRFLDSVAYQLDDYEKHREDQKIPSDEELSSLLKEESIKWNFQPPAQVGFQDYAVWWTDEVRQFFLRCI